MRPAMSRATLGFGLAGALLSLTAAGPARAHDWEELQGAESVEQARLALEVARRAVGDAAEGYSGPRLAAGASANDWRRWFTGVAELASRAGQRRLAERLLAAGFVAPGLEEFAVEEWRHVAGHVI